MRVYAEDKVTPKFLSVVPFDVVHLFLSRRRNEPHFVSYEFPILDFAQKPNLIAHLRLPVESRNRKTGLTMFSFEADCLKFHSIHTSDMSCERVRFHRHKRSP